MGFFSSPDIPEPDWKALYYQYRTWQADDEERYKQEMDSTMAYLKRSGYGENSRIYQRQIANLTADHERQRLELQEGATGTMLKEHHKGSTARPWVQGAESLGYQSAQADTPIEQWVHRFGREDVVQGARSFVEQQGTPESQKLVDSLEFDNWYKAQYGEPDYSQYEADNYLESPGMQQARKASSGQL